jgi:hypothetical protein
MSSSRIFIVRDTLFPPLLKLPLNPNRLALLTSPHLLTTLPVVEISMLRVVNLNGPRRKKGPRSSSNFLTKDLSKKWSTLLIPILKFQNKWFSREMVWTKMKKRSQLILKLLPITSLKLPTQIRKRIRIWENQDISVTQSNLARPNQLIIKILRVLQG